MSTIRSRWDWYEATLESLDDNRVAPSLATVLPGATLVRGKGRNGYATCWVIQREEAVLAQVYGGSAREGEVHVTTTSESCDEVVPVLRRLYPEHRVSRADSAVDYREDFEKIDSQVLAFARDRGLSHRLITDSAGGATRYLGSPSSEVRLRVYKKSEQLRAIHPEAAHTVPDGIVRFEVQVRPGKRDLKAVLGQVGPDDAWGFAQWSSDLAQDVLTIDAERVSTHFRRPSDWSRALHFLGRQYGPVVQRRAEEVGMEQARSELLEALGLGVMEGAV